MVSVKLNITGRVPSPDSACEQDWAPTSAIPPPSSDYSQVVSAAYDTTSDTSDSTNTSSQRNHMLSTNSRKRGEKQFPDMQQDSEKPVLNGGFHLHDSDGDSGIVALGRKNGRIGSTCSNETDRSQDHIKRKEQTSQPTHNCKYIPNTNTQELLNRCSLKPSLKASSVSNMHTCNGPLKGDHTIISETTSSTNRSGKLTVNSLSCKEFSNPKVRFDEELQLTEHSIRRSCRKLFATLYAQKSATLKFEPSQIANVVSSNTSKTKLPIGITDNYNSICSELNQKYSFSKTQGTRGVSSLVRTGCYTLPPKTTGSMFRASWSPDIDLKKQCGHKMRPRLGQQLSNFSSTGNLYNSNANRKVLISEKATNYVKSHPNGDISAETPTTLIQASKDVNQKCSYPTTTKRVPTLETITQANFPESSHISSKSSWASQATGHRRSKSTLFKSRSCTTLSGELSLHTTNCSSLDSSLSTHQGNDEQMVLLSSRSVEANNGPKEKSPCGTIVVKKVHLDRDSDCVLYSDDMIRVYARLASVVPEGTTVQEATTSQSTYNVRTRNKTSRHSLDAKSNYFQVSEYADYAHVLGDPGSKQAVCSKSRIKGPSCPETYNTSDSVLGRTVPELLVVTAAEQAQLGCIPKGQTLAVVDNTGAGMVNSVQCSSSAVPVVTQASISVKADKMESPEYAVVDKSKKSRRPMQTTSLSRITSNPCISNSKGGSPCEEQEPPVPPKVFMHRSDFALYKETSSKKSVIERVQGFTKSAKSALQRAFSTERICREEKLGTTLKLRRSQSFIKVLKNRMSMRGVKGKTCNLRETSGHASANSHLETADTENEHPLLPNHVWGQLIQLHVDGSQVVELSKPPKKPFGFFLARGTIRNCRGVFVSRMRDHETQKLLSGLIDIGDEILEIDGVDVKEKDIVEVNSLMSNKNNIVLTVLPYSSRLDV